jgi:hypothetical protein
MTSRSLSTSSESDLFSKRVIPRLPASSILTALLTSPKRPCSSSGFSSPSDVFSDDETSVTGTLTPPSRIPSRIPSRKSCVSFAAALPKLSQTLPLTESRGLTVRYSPRKVDLGPEECSFGESHVKIRRGLSKDESDIGTRPFVGSVFDEYGDGNSSPVFLDLYQIGQPKKLVDDCLKKEKVLQMASNRDDQDDNEEDDEDNPKSDIEEEEEEDDDDENESSADEEHSSDDETEDDLSIKAKRDYFAHRLKLRLTKLQKPKDPTPLGTPSQDPLENFIPGTLDEDNLPEYGPPLPPSPHDIDPTYPSESDEETSNKSSRQDFRTPVRFLRPRSNEMRLVTTTSLPLRKRCHVEKRTATRCLAINIQKGFEHKRHHRKDRQDGEVPKGVGVEAMAQMAKQLVRRHPMGLLALSV